MKRMFFNLGNTHPQLSAQGLQGVEVLAGMYTKSQAEVYFLKGGVVSGVYPLSALSDGWPSLTGNPPRPVSTPKEETACYVLLWGKDGDKDFEMESITKEELEDNLNDPSDELNFQRELMSNSLRLGRVTIIQPSKKTVKKEVLCVD